MISPRALGLAEVQRSQSPLVRIAAAGVALAVAALAARAALAPDLRELDRLRTRGTFHPRKPVLLCNPWSGGGKVAKFGLANIAAGMGVETVFLDHGLDLADLAHHAIARGADCLGMAGGDGSQALVASIATSTTSRSSASRPGRVTTSPRTWASTRKTRARAWPPFATASSASSTTRRSVTVSS